MSLKATWSNYPPSVKFLMTIGIVICGAFVFTSMAGFLASFYYGIPPDGMEELLKDLENPVAISVFKLLQTFNEIGAFILPALLLGYLFGESPAGYLHLDKKVTLVSIALVFLLLLSCVPLINFLGELNSKMTLPSWLGGLEGAMKATEEQAAKLTRKFLEINTTSEFVFAIIMIGILPALGEEFLFRGVLQRIFSEWSGNRHTGIWATAILFSAIHMQFYGFVPRMLLGVLLGYLFLWSGSLWLPILAHFINNASAVIAIYLYNKELITINPDAIGTASDNTSLLVSLGLTALLLSAIYRREGRRKVDSTTE